MFVVGQIQSCGFKYHESNGTASSPGLARCLEQTHVPQPCIFHSHHDHAMAVSNRPDNFFQTEYDCLSMTM